MYLHIELTSRKSINQINKLFKSVTESIILNKITEEKVILPLQLTDGIKELQIKLS